MFRPKLITPAAVLPITVAEAKLAIRKDGSDLDTEIEAAIKAAVSHYEGWNGILGILLVEQTWRAQFSYFDRRLCLPLRPVKSITSIAWKATDGASFTVDEENYELEADAGGSYLVRFVDAYGFPTGLYQSGPLSVDYVGGWPVVGGKATTPEDIKTAIKIRVQMQVDEAATVNLDHLRTFERELSKKYRPPRI